MKIARLVLFAALALPLAAQHEAAPAAEGHGAAQSHEEKKEPSEVWKWANFLLLAGIIGYFVGKNAGPFFNERSRQIRKDMVEAEAMRKDAEARAAEVDRKLSNLGADIAALKQESGQAQAAEMARMREQTAAEIAKVQHQAQVEIEAAGKAARMELRRYSAQLAVDLAEQRIRARITPDAQDALVSGFVRDLQAPGKSTR